MDDAAHFDVLKAEDDLDSQRKSCRVADEGTEGHGIDDVHDPGLLVAEDTVLAPKAVFNKKTYVIKC